MPASPYIRALGTKVSRLTNDLADKAGTVVYSVEFLTQQLDQLPPEVLAQLPAEFRTAANDALSASRETARLIHELHDLIA